MTETTNNNGDPNPRRRKASASSRRRTRICLIFPIAIVFLLNSLNGKKLIDSVSEQLGLQLESSSQPTALDGRLFEIKTEETAIIVSSSWIPSHPSTHMIDTVLNSTERLIGLSPTAPIFITVDHIRFTDFANLPPGLKDRINALDEYIVELFNKYLTDPRIHVIPSARHMHIGGSVMKAMNLIELHYPTVRYVYYLQHDFSFFKDIDHTALANAMNKYPEKINYIRFLKRSVGISHKCGDEDPIKYNLTLSSTDKANNITSSTLTLSPTNAYSDNNHLARLSWYKETIRSLVKLNRAPENPLQVRANNGCLGRSDNLGLYLYHDQTIVHLDGRHRVGRRL